MTYKRLLEAWLVTTVVALSVATIVLAPGLIDKASKALDKFLPPDLPEYTLPEQGRWLDQNWSAENRFWFHHTSQGTSTLPLPYNWFVALEQPRFWLTGDPPMFKNSEYLGRFGFIPSPKSLEIENPRLADFGYSPEIMEAYSDRNLAYDAVKFTGNDDGLPVGFARLNTGPNKGQISPPVVLILPLRQPAHQPPSNKHLIWFAPAAQSFRLADYRPMPPGQPIRSCRKSYNIWVHFALPMSFTRPSTWWPLNGLI